MLILKGKISDMKCLCFSDSHGSVGYIKRALDMHPDAEAVFFLGDGICDIEPLAASDTRRAWFIVRGNRDFTSVICDREIKKIESVTLMGRLITYTHGDLYGAKYGSDGLILLAERTGSDIILFGHTHSPFEKYFETSHGGVYLFNPGTANSSERAPTFGIMTLTERDVLFSHGSFV